MSPPSFDEFYLSSRQRVLRYVYAVNGDLQDAQDVLQEAYARAWQHWGRIGDYGDPEAWVRTVAYRIAVSRWRRTKSALTAHRRHGAEPAAPAPDENTVALVTALRGIPEDQRRAIVLHHLAGRSVAEIAAETGVAEGTVKARLSRGRQALAPLLRTETTGRRHA
ncbi:SigE family RNA polymerase sigma factor [Catellatospora vulcania]|uniref:SigE family RNA polymerase sigma factor n=1 Tax=Catellatospora vulcania TaxID=1460450 RepID=UPI0012D47EA1|nr:SigE family RNA polymerase sigma factor [Catellatospora vulcania]